MNLVKFTFFVLDFAADDFLDGDVIEALDFLADDEVGFFARGLPAVADLTVVDFFAEGVLVLDAVVVAVLDFAPLLGFLFYNADIKTKY